MPSLFDARNCEAGRCSRSGVRSDCWGRNQEDSPLRCHTEQLREQNVTIYDCCSNYGAEHKVKLFPIYVLVQQSKQAGLSKDSVVLCNQIRAIDESRIRRTLGHLTEPDMQRVDQALKISLALP